MHVYPLFLVERAEVRDLVRRFRQAEEQQPPGIEGEIEDLESAGLGAAIQVDQQVAAGNQVEPGERRILQEIVRREHHHFPDFTAHAVAVRLLCEESAQAPVADIGGDGIGIQAAARGLYGFVVKVGREYLHHGRRIQAAAVLGQQYRERIGLLTGSARRHPDPHDIVRFLRLENPRQVGSERARKRRGRGKNS